MNEITQKHVEAYHQYLLEEEKSEATISKYLHDVKMFAEWVNHTELTKSKVLLYKNHLIEHYSAASINSMLSSLNSFFVYMGWLGLKVKTIKIQRQMFASSDKELTKTEYERLLKVAKDKNNERLYLLMQAICASGIRVSELKHITVEAIRTGQAEINCKGKRRKVFLPYELCKMLKKYVGEQKIKSGPIFITKNGNPLDRSNIWSDMKKLC